MSNPSPGFKKKAGGQNFKKIFVNICAVCKARCTHPIIAIEVFRRRPPRFAERFLGQLCGSSLPKVCRYEKHVSKAMPKIWKQMCKVCVTGFCKACEGYRRYVYNVKVH